MCRRILRYWLGLLPLALAVSASAISCLTQSQMTAAGRSSLEHAALEIAGNVRAGNMAALKAETAPLVAAQFAGIADSIQAVQPSIAQATLTVDALYRLDAGDLAHPEEAQFFCGIPDSPLIVTLTIPNLPRGQYALAIVHATGVGHPQQLSFILSESQPHSGRWQLAGFFPRPMTMGGHDGVWFWQQAREYAARKQLWNAWFYYQAAQYLLAPVDFLSSPNLQRLRSEAQNVEPEGLPAAAPMPLADGNQTFAVTNLHPGELGNHLDLVVTYNGSGGTDPVTERAQVIAVMRALVAEHPELASAFQGLWVYATPPDHGPPFALELPMSQIQPEAGQRKAPTVIPRKQAG